LGTTVFIGHYLLLSLIYLPALTKNDIQVLSEVSRQSRRWLYISIAIFALTGTYLTIVDPNYLGFANFSNVWGILMLIKHLLIVAMIAMGFWFNAILRIGPMMSSKSGALQALARFRLYTNLMTVSGVLVLLLTALAQVK
jgi:uncharacterized membrane protein